MTPQEFCKIYTEIYGEPLENLEQLNKQTFSGQELFEFVNDVMKLYKPNPLKVMVASDMAEIGQRLKEFTRNNNHVIVIPEDVELKPMPKINEIALKSLKAETVFIAPTSRRERRKNRK